MKINGGTTKKIKILNLPLVYTYMGYNVCVM